MSETSKKFFIDTNIIMYAAGKDNVYKESCLKVLENISNYEYEYYTNTEVFQEILYRYNNIGLRAFGMELAESFLELINEVMPITVEDIYMSISFMKKYGLLCSRDSVIIGNMLNNDIRHIISVDKDFDKVKEITRLDPAVL